MYITCWSTMNPSVHRAHAKNMLRIEVLYIDNFQILHCTCRAHTITISRLATELGKNKADLEGRLSQVSPWIAHMFAFGMKADLSDPLMRLQFAAYSGGADIADIFAGWQNAAPNGQQPGPEDAAGHHNNANSGMSIFVNCWKRRDAARMRVKGNHVRDGRDSGSVAHHPSVWFSGSCRLSDQTRGCRLLAVLVVGSHH